VDAGCCAASPLGDWTRESRSWFEQAGHAVSGLVTCWRRGADRDALPQLDDGFEGATAWAVGVEALRRRSWACGQVAFGSVDGTYGEGVG